MGTPDEAQLDRTLVPGTAPELDRTRQLDRTLVPGDEIRLEAPAGTGDLTPELLERPVWTDAMVAAAGIPIMDVPLVTVGGGIGSFVTVDYLRIAGVPASRIRVLSNIDFPWKTYEYLTRVSQIPDEARIRSDSSSRPDNIWGFPSYALTEARRDKNIGNLMHVL